MEKKFIRITLLVAIISSTTFLVFMFIRYYNYPENIEKRCINRFQKDFKKAAGKSDEEWGLNMDIAYVNYFKCMKIP